MTREEAIKLIEAARKTMYLPKSKEYISDLGYALEMAIIALEQEPCEDCISRQAVLDTLMKCEEPCEDRQDFYLDSTTEFEEKIKELPPVNPKQKIGHWIKSSIGGAKICSICQAHMGLSSFKFCPNCGAKMESEG